MRRMRKALSLLMALIMLTGCGSSLETQKPIVEDAQVIDEQGTHVTDEIEAGGQVTGAQVTDTLVSDAQATDPRTVDEQQIVLTIATCGSGRLHMEAIEQFNTSNSRYQIVVSNYLEEADGNIHVAVTNLIKEIISGSGPDLIDLSSWPIAYERLCESGALTDLSDYFDNDPSISTDQVVDSVMNSLTYQGGIYAVMSGFTVKTMVSSRDFLEDNVNWSLSDFMPYLNSIGPALLKSDDVIDPKSMLVQLSQTTLQSFVDYQSGVAYFDSDAFVELLKASKQTDSANDASSAPEVRLASVGDFMQQQVRESIAGGEIKYIGFPTLDPSASGNFINNQNDYLALSAVSSQKDACWEYLKLVMSEDFQNQVYIKPIADTFPTNKAAMENMIRYSSEPQYDEDGEEIHVRGMYNYDYQPATTAQIDSIMNLIDSLERSQREDLTVYEILSEELQAYYESDLSADKVAENIQNRVSVYLGEIQN